MINTIQTDTVVEQLQALAIADAMYGDRARIHVLRAMIEAYLHGLVDISFDVTGEPTATLIEYEAPVVHTPLFPSVHSFTDTDTEPKKSRLIGFDTN